jgi:hypothetical protein
MDPTLTLTHAQTREQQRQEELAWLSGAQGSAREDVEQQLEDDLGQQLEDELELELMGAGRGEGEGGQDAEVRVLQRR